ncbi:MAG: carbohydrate binding family 9 domain-containing protein, partial [Chitinophagaceae bacterium]|nr:carbohydrate binding family 9 domain-containing protein [Chitinophagaceae bacterium]
MRSLFVLLATLLALSTWAQFKKLDALKINTPLKIDGQLNEAGWKQASAADSFILNSPQFGIPASQRTIVKILYDDQAIYVGAYLYDDPQLVRKQLTARDGEQRKDVDYFSVFFDTYNDDQNGFQFLVTSRNVQSDARLLPNLSSQFGTPSDYSWDAVWESKVHMQNDGWTVEMKIPYSALRFSQKEAQDWGLNFQRYNRRNNESSFWNAIDPNQNGFVNQFGDLAGLQNIKPPIRLSFLPYVTAGIRKVPLPAGGSKTDVLRNGGMDVKYGVNESFTLDATLIPDFGQVISDNVILNLSPYEVQFQENRPFFTEGIELFNKAGLFYSRRVGGTPRGYNAVRNMVNSDPNLLLVSNPGVTQLY